jgi:hypothetical protein
MPDDERREPTRISDDAVVDAEGQLVSESELETAGE